MKRYYNATTKEWYTECQTITRKVDNGVFSGIPSVEQLYEWGFKEWIEPAPTPYEPTEEDVRKQRMDEILAELAETDYLALKAFEGEDMSEHPGWKEKRAALRAEYRQLESEVQNV